jgi:hypothetical protein
MRAVIWAAALVALPGTCIAGGDAHPRAFAPPLPRQGLCAPLSPCQRRRIPSCRPALGALRLAAQVQNPVPTAREGWADEAIPVAKLFGAGEGMMAPGGADSQLSERVFIAVQVRS